MKGRERVTNIGSTHLMARVTLGHFRRDGQKGSLSFTRNLRGVSARNLLIDETLQTNDSGCGILLIGY